MSNYDYVCTFNLDDCIKALGLEEKGRVQQYVTKEFMKKVEPFVPFDEAGKYENPGRLVESCHIENDTDVVWKTPYVRRHYYHPEYNFQKANNPHAGGEWLEPWIDGDRKDFVRETFESLLKKEAKL